MQKYVRLCIILLLGLILSVSCSSVKYFPDFTIKSYMNETTKSVSSLIEDNTAIIWMPLNSCGVCLQSIMECLRDKKSNFKGLVITTDSNPLQYNWIKLNIKDLKNSSSYFYVGSELYDLLGKRFYDKNKSPIIFVVTKDRKIIKSVMLGSAKEGISNNSNKICSL